MKKALLLSSLTVLLVFNSAGASEIESPADVACRPFKQQALQEVAFLKTIPGLQSEALVQEALAPFLDHFCLQRIALFYFKNQGELCNLVTGEIREDLLGATLSLANPDGSFVGNGLIRQHIQELASRYWRELYNKPKPEQDPTTRHFVLTMARPNEWRIGWRLDSGDAADSGDETVLRINQGDTVAVELKRNLYFPHEIARFRLAGYGFNLDVPLAPGNPYSFVAEQAGMFSFFDPRSPHRSIGWLIVEPRY
ncbi:MAG: hypothetical protein HY401_01680 [Elusimicrobia bacterium]|nr:hypothetical protein [Elusimicrobiota bacterium]